ncbi:MAG: LamG domain-containing protein [Candidatus Paceibacterota bacterium]
MTNDKNNTNAKDNGKITKKDLLLTAIVLAGIVGLSNISIQGVDDNSLIFQPPTPIDYAQAEKNSTEINLSIQTDNLDTFKFNWNGTNVSVYDSSLLLAVNFDNLAFLGESTSVAKDFSKNNYTVTLTGVSYTQGVFGSGVSFGGDGDRGEAPVLALNDSYTMGGWVKLNSVSTSQSMLSLGKCDSDGVSIFPVITSHSNNAGFLICSSAVDFSYTNIALNVGEWTHIMLRKDAGVFHFYINGTEYPFTNTYSQRIPTAYTTIGANVAGAYDRLNGAVDEVRVYNRSLSSDEIAFQYQSEFKKYNSTEYRFYVNVTNLSSGTYTYYGWANDTSGNIGQTAARTLTVDTVAPSISFTSPTKLSNESTNQNSLYVNVSVNDSSNMTAFIDYNRSLVGWWRFNNEAGENSTFVRDWSSYGNNGTCSGSYCPAWTSSGRFGGAYQFDGYNDYVYTVSFNGQPTGNVPVTVEAWIKPAEFTRQHNFVCLGHDSAMATAYGLYTTTDGKVAVGFSSWLGEAVGNTSLETGLWYHIIGVYNGSTNKVYVNGLLDKTVNYSSGNISAGRMYVGVWCNYEASIKTVQFNGSIDEVRIYNRVISSEEINASYNAGLNRLYRNYTNLSDGYYNYTAYVQDAAGNVNSTTASNVLVDTTSPSLNFTYPTTDNGSFINVNYSQVNISITEQNLDSFKFNWNGTNYSIYDDSLVLALNFNNNSAIGENSTRFVDISKYENNGTCSGSTCPTYTSTGKFNGAYQFDGIEDYIDLNQTDLIWNYSTSNSLYFWIKVNSLFPEFPVIANFKTSNNTGIGIFLYDGVDICSNVDDIRIRTDGDISGSFVGTWKNVVITYNGVNKSDTSNYKIYVDGVSQVLVYGIPWNAPYINLIGVNEVGASDDYLTGSLDEIRLYRRELSQEEILFMYESELSKYNSTEYRFYSNITNISEGSYQYYGWANDSAGNSGVSETRSLTVDMIYPLVSIISGPLNHSRQTTNYTIINSSIREDKLNSSGIILDGVDYPIYDDSLVLAMNFNNNSAIGENETRVVDISRYSNNLTLGTNSTNIPTYVNGRYNYGIQFDGSDDIAQTIEQIPDTNSITIEGWFWTSNQSYVLGATRAIYTTPNCYTNDCGFDFKIGPTGFGFLVETDNLTEGYCYAPVANDSWHHLVATYSSGNIILYVDGVLTNSTMLVGSTGIDFGNRKIYFSNLGKYKGKIDEVRIWNRVLSAAEIALHYQSEFKKYNSTEYRLWINITEQSKGKHDYSIYASDDYLYNETETRTYTISTAPVLEFEYPTEDNRSVIDRNYTEINISIKEENLDVLNVNWNGIQYNVTEGLLLGLDFDNNSRIGENDSTFVDISQYNNNGSCSGTSCPTFNASGRFNGAYQFDGTDDYIELGNDNSLDVTSELTVEGWIKGNPQEGKVIIAKYDYGLSKRTYSLMSGIVSQDKLLIVLSDDGSNIDKLYESSITTLDNTWKHIALTFNGTDISIYINGVLDNSPTKTVDDPINGLYSSDANTSIGAYVLSSGVKEAFFNGSIDKLRVYNKTLSQEDILFIYDSEYSKYNTSEYRFYKNISGLSYGVYMHSAWANDTAGNYNSTGTRKLTCDLDVELIFSEWCYQESATVFNQSGMDGSCGLRYNGSYSLPTLYHPINIVDGNDSTSATGSYLYVNYTKPDNSVNTSLWRVKAVFEESAEIRNLSIPYPCWNYSEVTLNLRAYACGFDWYSCSSEDDDSVGFSCWNGSSWQNIYNHSNVSVQYSMYEEGMWWNISEEKYSFYSWNGNKWIYDMEPLIRVNWSCPRGKNYCTPRYQNSSQGVMMIYNKRNMSGAYMRLNQTSDYITVFCGNNASYTSDYVRTINTDWKKVCDLDIYENCTLWCWVNNSLNSSLYGYSSFLFDMNFSNFPTIYFEEPTEDNGTYISENHTKIVLYSSFTDEDAASNISFNWNDEINMSIFDDSLVLSLNFDNNSYIGENSITAKDTSKYNATITHSLQSIEGKFGKALNYTGSSGTGIAGSPYDIYDTPQFTLEAWIYQLNRTGTVANKGIVAGRSFRWPYCMYISNTGYIVSGLTWSDDNTEYTTVSNNIIPLNTWTHVALSYNGSHVITWINGVFDKSTAKNKDLKLGTNNNFKIGYLDTTNYFNGTIDEVRLYNRSLSNEEIRLHYLINLKYKLPNEYEITMNITNLTDGEYHYQGWSQNSEGHGAETERRTLYVNKEAPVLTFQDPTPIDEESLTNNWVDINVSISDVARNTFGVTWGSTNCSIDDTYLKLALNFNNNSEIGDNSTYSVDISRYENNGVISNGSYVEGKFGLGLNFNTSSRITIQDMSNISKSYTIMHWLKPNPTSYNYPPILYKKSGNNGFLEYFRKATNEVRLVMYNSSGTNFECQQTSDYWINTWKQVVWTYSNYSGETKLYLDGTLSKTCTNQKDIITNSADLLIGSDGTYGYNGTIDELRIYSRVLSAEEIAIQYKSEYTRYNDSTYRFITNMSAGTGTQKFSAWAKDNMNNYGTTEIRTVYIN